MSEDDKKGLVPTLRFPEFEDAENWEPQKLGDKKVSEFVKKRLPLGELAIETYVSTENILPDFGGITTASKLPPAGSFTAYKSGDILIANIRPYLKKVWVANRSGGASNDVVVVRPKKGNNFISSILKNDVFINYVMLGAKGVKMPRGDVTLMKEYPIALPNPKEQKKIADFLSSLDELIAAHNIKYEALQSYKKGLIQNLFPAEGENIPALRFPEFKDSREWVERRLDQITDSVFDGTHQTPKYTEDGIPFYSVENIVSGKANKFISIEDYREATKKNKPQKDDVLVTRIGNIGFSTVVDWDHEFSIYVTLATIKSDKRFNSQYLHGYIQSERYQTEIYKKSLLNAVPCKINMDELRKTEVLLPCPKEQQKIAECFLSVNELIASHVRKIEVLKAHKKGLIQQIFCAVGEAKV